MLFLVAFAYQTSHKLAADQLSLQPEATPVPCVTGQQTLGGEGWASVPHLDVPSLPGEVGTQCQVHYEGRKTYPA